MENQQIMIQRPGNHSVLKKVIMPIPDLGHNQVLIKNQSVGVAFADVLMREGLYPDVPRKNLTPGYDVVGEIVAIGSNVKSFKAGQRVLALTQTGGYAKFTVADELLTLPCPMELDPFQAVSIVLNYTTALQMLTRIAKVKAGESILVHGVAGGVGSALAELALKMDVKVYGTLSKRKWQSLPEHIDQHPNLTKIDYQTAPFEASINKLAPQGINAVFDAIGGKHLKRSYRVLDAGGIAVSYGFSTAIRNGRRNLLTAAKGLIQSTLSPVQMISDNKIMAGYGIWVFANAHPQWFREDLQTLINWLEAGEIKPIIGKVLPLEKAREAHQLIESSQTPGKIVLEI